eukprot:1332185-Amorphochlora_amoeboformis.AAC.1
MGGLELGSAELGLESVRDEVKVRARVRIRVQVRYWITQFGKIICFAESSDVSVGQGLGFELYVGFEGE